MADKIYGVKENKCLVELVNAIYPIGSIYLSVANTNPSELFGGTWEAWGAGRVPVGINTTDSDFGTVEKIGGEKSHVLDPGEGAYHEHEYSLVEPRVTLETRQFASGTGTSTKLIASVYPEESREGTQLMGEHSLPHNNLQPYITCYMWKRTA